MDIFIPHPYLAATALAFGALAAFAAGTFVGALVLPSSRKEIGLLALVVCCFAAMVAAAFGAFAWGMFA